MSEGMGNRVFVGNITSRVQKHELKTDFEKFGRVHEVFIGNGFGFVTFDDSRSADRAVDVSIVVMNICDVLTGFC